MRIAIDGRELLGERTGVGRYLDELLTAWQAQPGIDAHEFVLCTPEPVDRVLDGLRLTSAVSPGHGTLWEQVVLPRLLREARVDVLFAPAYTAPLRAPVPYAAAIHDVSFAAHPEWFSWREGLRRRLITSWTATHAARVLTVSHFSKREIVRCLGADVDRIEVIYHGAHVSPVTPRATTTAPLVLYVGSLFQRRHIPELIGGVAALARRRPDVRLALIGANRTEPRLDIDGLIARTGVADRIVARAWVDDAELERLYAEASAFVFLSDYEGFGLTPLEALAHGLPIVVLDTAVAREIYGEGACYVARPEPALVEQALERVLFDPAERARLAHAAAGVLSRYSWTECGRLTLDAIVASGTRARR